MSRQNLEHLYAQYKNCLRKEYETYFGQGDSYKGYLVGCENQREDIINFAREQFSKTTEFQKNPEELLERKAEEYSFKLSRFGFDTRVSRNL